MRFPANATTANDGSPRKGRPCLLLCLGLSFALPAAAASFEFLGVESLFTRPPAAAEVHRYAIVIASSRRRFNVLPQKNQNLLREFFVYQTRVKVQGQTFYRLAAGNFKTSRSARIALQRLQQTFTDAWVFQRSGAERVQLAENIGKSPSRLRAGEPRAASADATRLLQQARNEFIDGNYARMIAITDKIIVIGSLDQVREALELAGIARERQKKFSQAIVLYEALLDTQPAPEIVSRIEGRLEGIRTMNLTPKKRIAAAAAEGPGKWRYRGIVQQFYQDDEIDRPGEDLESVNRALITDLDLYAQKRSDSDDMVMRLDAGLVNDFLTASDDIRISRASIEYARDRFRLIGGRQTRTLSGVYGRFDGLTLQDVSRTDYRLNYAYGTLVQSSFDAIESDRPFVGVSLDTNPRPWAEISVYAINQKIHGLTDRRAVGSELRLQNQSGFAYATIDYDTFFDKLANVSLVSNYRPDNNWSFNLTLERRYSPTLATINALQGQSVEEIDDLRDLFSKREIYALAEDRTSRTYTLFFGTNYRFDTNRHLYLNYSQLELDATEASGGVESVPASEDIQLVLEYAFQGLLFKRDYASLGLRLSESFSSETASLRIRTRFKGAAGITFDPRLQLDRRRDKADGREQLIVKPSLKLKYRVNKKTNLEGTFGIEYSDLDLPELDKQYTYSIYVGYYYLF